MSVNQTLDKQIDYKNEKSSPYIIISPNGKNLISYSDWWEEENARIDVWNLHSAKLLYSISEPVYLALVSSDGKLIYDSAADKKIKIRDLNSGDLKYTLTEESDSIMTMTISSDNSYFICGTKSGIVQIWNLQTGDLLNTLTGHEYPINSVVLSHNGEIIVSTDIKGTAKVWKAN